MNQNMSIFAYGSLLWDNEDLSPINVTPATLRGWSRSYNKKSITNRGTKMHPGLVLGLEQNPQHCCKGTIITIPNSAFTQLQEREHGYKLVTLPVFDQEKQTNRFCTVFVPDTQSELYIAPNTLTNEQKAHMALNSQPQNGKPSDYVTTMFYQLNQLGIEDEAVIEMYTELTRLEQHSR
ncbi:MAG: gamma-glutamylcyclotransferase [Candidatus Woesearchaeota archaeon]